jgi:integrase
MSTRRTNGDGSIYFDAAKGRWVGAITLGYLDSKPIRRKVSAKTKTACAARLRDLREAHANEQLPAVGATITVERWMNYWLTQIAARKVRPTTYASYESKIAQYINPLLGHHRIDKLTPEHIEAAWERLLTVGNPKADEPVPLAPASVRQTHRILARALKVAVQRRRLARNPADGNSMDAPSVPFREMDVLTVEQVKKVLDAAKGDRLEARWAIALSLGLRQGEALGLRWVDVDLGEGVIHVRQTLYRVKGKGLMFGEPKSVQSRRDVVLHPELVKILKAHKKRQTSERLEMGSAWTDSGLVFTQASGKPIDPARDSAAWRRLMVAAKVPPVRLHDARHSAATVMLLQGVSTRVVMETLGHSQISVTSKYQHAVDELKRDAAQRTGDALWG